MDSMLFVLIAFVLGFILIVFFKKTSPQIIEEGQKEDEEINAMFEKVVGTRENMLESIQKVIEKLGLEIEESIEKSEGHFLIRAINKTPIVGGRFLFECIWRGKVLESDTVYRFKEYLKGEEIPKGTIFCFDEISREARKICEESNIEIYNKEDFLRLINNSN